MAQLLQVFILSFSQSKIIDFNLVKKTANNFATVSSLTHRVCLVSRSIIRHNIDTLLS